MLKLLHASDIHIGAKFSSFGEKAALQRQALLDAFAKIIDLAIGEQVQLLLIAGDLFDSNFPSYQSVSFVKDQLKKLDNAGIYVVILPGTHDCLSRDSIFKRENFTAGTQHVFIFDNPEETQKEFPDFDLTIFGKPNLSNKSSDSPLAFIKDKARGSKSKYKIAMAHGSVQIEGKAASDDLPIAFQDIADSGMEYIALGHWHGAQDFSSGNVKAWYAGSPEITYQEGKGGLGQGYALKVEIGQNETFVSPMKITEKEIKEINFDLQMFDNKEALYQEIEKLVNPNLILSVSLSGFANAENLLSFQKIEEDFQNKFFYIKVKNNLSLRLEDVDSRNYPEELVLGQFVRVMQEKINKAANDNEKSILEDALQIGIAELEGKNII
mgnify:CR=1 FL=1